MTNFYRKGHYRTNQFGTHWVSGHDVNRNDWGDWEHGDESKSQELFQLYLNQARVNDSVTAMYVNPNADCPVCGEKVFFYQNKNGSKVYFDELGPPWPKHPCTDSKYNSSPVNFNVDSIEPQIRNDTEILCIEHCISNLSNHPDEGFAIRYKQKPWQILKILKRVKGVNGVFLILQKLQVSDGNKIFIYKKTLPKCLKEGSVLMMHKSTISFFDINTMEPVELQVRKIRNATLFVSEWTANPIIQTKGA